MINETIKKIAEWILLIFAVAVLAYVAVSFQGCACRTYTEKIPVNAPIAGGLPGFTEYVREQKSADSSWLCNIDDNGNAVIKYMKCK